jgi:hypothetical protein
VETGLLVSSVVLVLVTGVLAWVTGALWLETKAARRPRLVATLDVVGGMLGELRIVNAGTGAALNVDVSFSPEPSGTERRWRTAAVLSGAGVSFDLVSDDDQARAGLEGDKLDALVDAFPRIRVVGSYEGARGEEYDLDQTLDLAGEWSAAIAAEQLASFRGPMQPLYHIAESVEKSLRSLDDTGKALRSLAAGRMRRDSDGS